MLIPAGRKKMLEIFLKDPFKEIHLRDVGNNQSDTKNNNDGSVGKKFKIQFLPEIIFYKPS